MRRLELSSATDRAWLHALRDDSLESDDVEVAVRSIVRDVKARGDVAVLERTQHFDGATLTTLRLPDDELRALAAQCDPKLRAILHDAAQRIRAFHEPQKPQGFVLEGGRLRLRVHALDVVGLYVPGGRASYPSTVLMTAIPASVAGVARVCVATPPRKDGTIAPAIAAACLEAGVTDVFRMGGAQAVAAFAYGTESVPVVDKICGPGNAWVAAAKRQVAGRVGVDMFAGPSEVLIVDDGRGDVRHIALDLLAQAEHDPKAIALCVTTSRTLWESLPGVLAAELASVPNAVASMCVAERAAVILARDVEEALVFADAFAPEHLEWLADPALVDRITHAGAIFVGPHTPEPVGDYFAGPNHTLPTGGTSRFASALSTTDFVRKTHVIAWDEDELARHGDAIATFARAEGLIAHARSVEERHAHAPATTAVDVTQYVLASVTRQKAYTLEAPPEAPIKLNQNEAAEDLPSSLKAEILAGFSRVDFRRYPPFDAGRVQRAIAEADGWQPDGVLVGNGSNELLTLLFRSVLGPGERVVRPSPCFSLYPLHLDATGAVQSLVHLKADDDFAWPVDELVKKSRSAKVVVVASPNNPTGSVLPPHAIDRLLRESNALIIIDEAYRDFCDQDFVSHLRHSERVVLLRTFSKAMAMAGLRFGYLLGAPALCRELLKVLLPYNVSTLTQDAALAVLARREVVTELCARVRDNRSTLTASLRARGRRVIEGGANFVLMGSPDPKAEFKALLAQGVLVRDLSSAVPGFLRVSVGTPAEHARLLQVLPELTA